MSDRKADNLLLFKSIIDAGSLSHAAKLAEISVSQTSKRMTQLETTLGVKLLQRSTRALGLTAAGELLYNKLSQIKNQIDEAWQSMLEYGDQPRGKLQLVSSYHYGNQQLMPLIQHFKQQYPEIDLVLDLLQSHHTKQTADLHFKSHILTQQELLPSCSLVAKKIYSEKLCYVASQEYLQRHNTPIHPKQLTAHDCLRIDTHPRKHWTFYQETLTLQPEIKPSFESNSFTTLYQAACNHMGIAQLPVSLLTNQNNDRLVRVLDEYHSETLDTFVYYDKKQLTTKKIRLFLQTIDAHTTAADNAAWPLDRIATAGFAPQMS